MKRPNKKDYRNKEKTFEFNLFEYSQAQDKYIDHLEAKKKRKRRSLKANSLYWLWMQCLEDESGQSKDDYHDYFKDKFIGIYTKDIFNRKVIKEPSTKELDSKAHSYYMRQVQSEAATEFNTRVPLPEDQGFEQFMDKYESFIK